jgi:ATP-dependent Clp protease adaptor protein ClpS
MKKSMSNIPESTIRMQWVPGPGESVKERTEQKVARPKRYKVLMHNDDYTTMEFVVEVLREVYRRNMDEAVRIMMAIHHEGLGIAGVYTAAIAETKIAQTHQRAREAGYPLRCTMEPE